MDAPSRSEQLDAEILDSVSELIGRIFALGEGVARRLSVPGIFIKALHTLECPMAMKDLGKARRILKAESQAMRDDVPLPKRRVVEAGPEDVVARRDG